MPNRFKGPTKQRLALSTFVKLMRASETVYGESSRWLAEEDLTVSQFGVLEALYHIGPMCLSELARKILKTSGNLTMVVDNLQKRGLVKRGPVAKDRRYVEVVLTDGGRKLMARVFPQHADRIAMMMSKLSAEEQERLGDLCRKLGRGERDESAPGEGSC